MYEVSFFSAVPALDEDGGIIEIKAVLQRTYHESIEIAEAWVRQGIYGEVVEWGEQGFIPQGALDYARANPGKPILMALITEETLQSGSVESPK